MRRMIPAAILCASLLAAWTSYAQVHLRFDPPDTNLAVSENGRLSIHIDDPLEIRTLDVVVSYDTTVVRSIGGGAGALYTDSGIFTFDGFESNEPGTWHGYAILMGAGLFVQGPGELYFWDFEALADGVCPVTAVEVALSMTDGSWYEQVMLADGKVSVGDPSGLELPPAQEGALGLAPNPFNPRTRIHLELPAAGPVHLAVYDLRGRCLDVLLEGPRGPGPVSLDWDGRDARGRSLPSGTYLFRLESPQGSWTARGILLR